ncbi:hypothetical protein PFISCL1PPCAC_4340, partial [Pristionchus fissidentatus]
AADSVNAKVARIGEPEAERQVFPARSFGGLPKELHALIIETYDFALKDILHLRATCKRMHSRVAASAYWLPSERMVTIKQESDPDGEVNTVVCGLLRAEIKPEKSDSEKSSYVSESEEEE